MPPVLDATLMLQQLVVPAARGASARQRGARRRRHHRQAPGAQGGCGRGQGRRHADRRGGRSRRGVRRARLAARPAPHGGRAGAAALDLPWSPTARPSCGSIPTAALYVADGAGPSPRRGQPLPGGGRGSGPAPTAGCSTRWWTTSPRRSATARRCEARRDGVVAGGSSTPPHRDGAQPEISNPAAVKASVSALWPIRAISSGLAFFGSCSASTTTQPE